jgi:hypothetical protein
MPHEITFEPSPKQYEAWQLLTDDVTTELGYGGAAHGGKSYLGCEWLTDMCLAYPGTGWLLGRKELLNLKRTTLLTLFKVFEHHGLEANRHFSYNQSSNIITFANESQIFLFDLGHQPSDPLYTRLGGLELTGAFVDESNEVPFAAIDVLKTRLGRRKNTEYGLIPKLFEGFNPDKGHVYTRFYKPWRDGQLPAHRKFIKALPGDNPHTTDDYLNQLRNADKVTKERLLFGNFEYDDDPNALIAYDAIIDLFTNTVDESKNRYLVCDAARFGGDFIPIFLFEGFRLYKIKVFRRQGLNVTREIIRQTLAEERIPYSHAIVDENGVGGGLVDDLKGIKGFVAQAAPMEPKNKPEDDPKEQYENLKAQCSYMLVDAVNKHHMAISLNSVQLPPDMTLAEFKEAVIADLEQVKRKDADKDSKLKIMGKDEVKEHLGRSPDFGDTLMMRMWFELKPPGSASVPPPTVGLVRPYYPELGV